MATTTFFFAPSASSSVPAPVVGRANMCVSVCTETFNWAQPPSAREDSGYTAHAKERSCTLHTMGTSLIVRTRANNPGYCP